MRIDEPKIKYKGGLPFEAELLHVGKQIPHRHLSELELVYCLQGSVHLIAAEQDLVLQADQLHSIDFRDMHYLNAIPGESNLVLLFHLDLSAMPDWENLRYVFFACEDVHCYPFQEEAMEKVKDIVLSLSYMYFQGNLISKEDCQVPLQTLVDTLFQYFNWFNYENQDEYVNQNLYDRFTRVLAYIIDNYNEKISVSQLASREHINKNYFSQFISKTIFSSFSTMVNYIRCYAAEAQLLTTDKPIAEISYDCGFSDPKYFYAAFKDLWHMTPTADRERYQKQYDEALAYRAASNISPKHAKALEPGHLTDRQAAAKVRDYITQWHIAKTFR